MPTRKPTEVPAWPWRGPSRAAWAARCLALLAAFFLPLRAAELGPAEFQAAFISKVLPYVSWPRESFAAPDAPVVVGLASRDPFDGLLQKVLAGVRVEDHPVEVRVVKDARSATNCHALFFGPEQLPLWKDWRPALAGRAVLTIAADDTGAFLDQGGVFNLRLGERKLEVSHANSEQARLRVSSKLLRIARVR